MVVTAAAAQRAARITALGSEYLPLGHVIDERSIVNAVVGLLATGGSTNHTLHIVAIAKAAGILAEDVALAEDMLKKHRDNGNKARTRGKSGVGSRRRKEAPEPDDAKPKPAAKKAAPRKPAKPSGK